MLLYDGYLILVWLSYVVEIDVVQVIGGFLVIIMQCDQILGCCIVIENFDFYIDVLIQIIMIFLLIMDCNGNFIDDLIDVLDLSLDLNNNGILDECDLSIDDLD